MLLNTQGLVLRTTKYGETSIVAKVFTRELGMRSYIVKGIRSAAGRTKQNLMQPLSHLDMTVYDNPKKEMQYIKEMHPAGAQAGGDGVKMSLMFFMDEVLYKSLKDEETNRPLFDYVVEELHQLDSCETGSFPIRFLLRTSRHLGIEPMDNYSASEPLFNLKEGRFLSRPNVHSPSSSLDTAYFLDTNASAQLHLCLDSLRRHTAQPQLTAQQRRTTLNHLLEYYHVHLNDFGNFKSHEVLHEVLR